MAKLPSDTWTTEVELREPTTSVGTPEVVVLDFRTVSLDGVFKVVDEFVKAIVCELDSPVKSVNVLCIIMGRPNAQVKDRILSVLDSFKHGGMLLTLAYAYSQDDFEGLFFCKSLVDERRNDEIEIVTSKASYRSLRAATEVFFPPSYKIHFRVAAGKPDTVAEKLSEADRKTALSNASAFLQKMPPFSGEKLDLLTSTLIPNDVFVHGFTTRTGGCSTYGTMSSLNLRYKDTLKDPMVAVLENQKRVARNAHFDHKLFYQTKPAHGVNVWVVGDVQPPDFDAITSSQTGHTIAVNGADCVLVLLADPVNDACAVVHSGWRGTLGNVVGETISAMTSREGSDVTDIRAVIGPSIGVCCFNEVGVADSFQKFKHMEDFVVKFKEDPVPHVNLQGAVKFQLELSGLLPHHIDDTSCNVCTCCNPHKFFSYHRDGDKFGLQIGFIGLRSVT